MAWSDPFSRACPHLGAVPLLALRQVEGDKSGRRRVQVGWVTENGYEGLLADGTRAGVFLDTLFDEDGDVVGPIGVLRDFPLTCENASWYVDISELATASGLPKGYFLKLFIFSLQREGGTTPLFPGEVKLDLTGPEALKEYVAEEGEEALAADVETINALSQKGERDIANNLLVGLVRLHETRAQEAILFFRKALEGLLPLLEKLDLGNHRGEQVGDVLKKSKHMMSNFGLHASTLAQLPEATLARDISLGLARYVATYLPFPREGELTRPSASAPLQL